MNTKLYMLKGKEKSMETETRFATVKLSGIDGNAFSIMGACRKAWIKDAGNSEESWKAIEEEMTSGDYNNILTTAFKHFDVY